MDPKGGPWTSRISLACALPRSTESEQSLAGSSHVCFDTSFSGRSWHSLKFENHGFKGLYEFTTLMIGFSEVWVMTSWVYKVSVLDLPAWSFLSLDDLTFLSRSTGAQLPVVQEPLALIPRSAVTLCFLGPLILYTLGKFTTGQEFAGICLISCKKQNRFSRMHECLSSGTGKTKARDQIYLLSPHFGVGCTVVITGWTEKRTTRFCIFEKWVYRNRW